MADVSRRMFLALSGTAAASVWLNADFSALRLAGTHAVTAEGFTVFTAADAVDIEAAAAQIIPTDETPGAREAKVIYFMDKMLEGDAKSDRPVFERGARVLRAKAAKRQKGARTFAELSAPLQIEILADLERTNHPFFSALREATIAGMLANPEYGGNADKIGWKWIGFDDRFVWFAPFGWYDRDA